MAYYDGCKLLSLKDLAGEKPEIFICSTNRTGGKTTYFNRLLMNHHMKKGTKFMLIYRHMNEMSDIATPFFKDIGELFFPTYWMESKPMSHGKYHILNLCWGDPDEPEKRECGYGVPLSAANFIKKNSHMFTDTAEMLFDELQPEDGVYGKTEVQDLISIHTSIARGQGKMVRYVPIYMVTNPISIINPFYSALGISNRIDGKTKFLRGNGWVMEQGYVEEAGEAQKKSAFNRAFGDTKYMAYNSQGVYLNDSTAFVQKMDGDSRYICTLKHKGASYAVRAYAEEGVYYVSAKADPTFPLKISVTLSDHSINYVMLKEYSFLTINLRKMFNLGCFRFQNLECKNALIDALSIT